MEQQYQKTTSWDNITFAECLKFIRTHWYLFVISILICGAAAYLLIASTPKIYQRSVRVMFSEDNKQSFGRFNDLDFFNETAMLPSKKTVDNEKELFKSNHLMLEVVKSLELKNKHTSKKEENNTNKPITIRNEEELLGLANYYSGKLNVDIIKNSTCLRLSITDQDIEKADKILTALVDEYNKMYIAKKRQFLDSTLNIINQRLADINYKPTAKEDVSETKTSNRTNRKKNSFTNTKKNQTGNGTSQYLLQKKEEITLAIMNISSNCKMMDTPTGSSMPVKPKKRTILLMAILIGFCIPYIYFFIRLHLNTKILNISEIEGDFSIIGIIPSFKKKNKKKEETINDFIVVEKDNHSAIGEDFRMLRNSLETNFNKEKKCHIVTFTSFEKGSGKSFISLNTAISFALIGKKVLFIDFDLHNKNISNLFGTNALGITDIDKNITIDEIITKNTIFPDMDVIFAGKTLPNPSDALTWEKLEKIFSDLTPKYDYIFIDTASINLFSDVSIIAESSELAVFIICENTTDRHALLEIESLQKNNRYKNIAVLYNKINKN